MFAILTVVLGRCTCVYVSVLLCIELTAPIDKSKDFRVRVGTGDFSLQQVMWDSL